MSSAPEVPTADAARPGPESLPATWPRVVNHVGLTVPDLEAAIEWYGRVLGFRLIRPVAEFASGHDHMGRLTSDLFRAFNADYGRMRTAFLAAGGGTALELFHFERPAYEEPDRAYPFWRGGFNHLCVTDPDIEGLAARIEANGGTRHSRIWEAFPGRPYRLCYCLDPFGFLIEIMTHSLEHVFANHNGSEAPHE